MVWWWLAACAPSEGDSDEGAEPTGDTGVADTAEPTTDIPVADLAGWLEDTPYRDWPSEPAPHPSAGPHFGDVRTWFSPSLADSLDEGRARHPVGAAAVKELYGDSGTNVLGHAVMVRVRQGASDDAWYWYEDFEGRNFADGRGVGLCSGCHSGGVDFVLSAP